MIVNYNPLTLTLSPKGRGNKCFNPVFSPSPLRGEGRGEGNKGFYLLITDHPTAELT
jgi:hypothetical protein